MMAKHLDKATLIRSMSYTPNGLFNHTAAIYQMLTGYPPDKVSPSGQLEPPIASRLSHRRQSRLEAEAAQRAGAAVRRTAAPAAGIGHHRQGRRGRLPRQGLRSLPHVSGPRQAHQARRSLAAQGGAAGAAEGSLRTAQRHQRFDARSREGAQRVTPSTSITARPSTWCCPARRAMRSTSRRNPTRCASATACTPSARACCCRAA